MKSSSGRLKKGRWLGIDPGERIFGIALLSLDHAYIQPVKNLEIADREHAYREFIRLISQYEIVGCVIGLPFAEGAWTRATERLYAIIRWFMNRIPGVEWRFVDETLTTFSVERYRLYEDERLDMFSACQILKKALNPEEPLYTSEDLARLRRMFIKPGE